MLDIEVKFNQTLQSILDDSGYLKLRDIDNKLSITGLSQWDEAYTIENVVVNGPLLTFKWTNDYGEGAEIELTRDDGTDWPPLN